MDKKAIKKELDEVLIQLKNNSKDAKFAEKLIDKAMSLKGQLCVEETELSIPVSDVKKRYDFGAFEVADCKGGILFHVHGGYFSYVTMRMTNLYDHLRTVLEMYNNINDADEMQKNVTTAVVNATWIDMQIPLNIGLSDEMLFGFAELAVKNLKELQEKMVNAELQEETHEENAKFENDMQLAEQIMLGDKNDRTVG